MEASAPSPVPLSPEVGRRRRTIDVMKDVRATLGPIDGPAWIREHMALAKRSTTAYEEAWQEDKYLLLWEAKP